MRKSHHFKSIMIKMCWVWCRKLRVKFMRSWLKYKVRLKLKWRLKLKSRRLKECKRYTNLTKLENNKTNRKIFNYPKNHHHHQINRTIPNNHHHNSLSKLTKPPTTKFPTTKPQTAIKSSYKRSTVWRKATLRSTWRKRLSLDFVNWMKSSSQSWRVRFCRNLIRRLKRLASWRPRWMRCSREKVWLMARSMWLLIEG